MSAVLDFLLVFLRQFAGGPGPIENNLVRFGMPAILWGTLLAVAWSRQRHQSLPREKLLVWGFGLGLARELLMLGFVSLQILGVIERGAAYAVFAPLERALAMASIVVVAGTFLRYILDDARPSHRYLQIGLGVTSLCLLIAFWQWPRHLAAFPGTQFHETWGAWLFHVPLFALIAIAIFLLGRRRGWLRNVVAVALVFFFLGEFLFFLNYATDRSYSHIICPIGNGFHILAIPLLGYVYLREQAVEKRRAEKALEAYRGHLEELVKERTAELTTVNAQLQQEIFERKRTEVEIAQRNIRLAAQNAVAATLSQSLELEMILNTALDMVLAVLEMEVGFVLLWDPDAQTLVLQIHRGQISLDDLKASMQEQCPCKRISTEAVTQMQATVLAVADDLAGCLSSCIVKEGLQTLVSVPLVSKGRAVGALTLGTQRAGAAQQPELELLTAIGQQVGMAIENARLYQETERWAGELTLLHRVSISLTSTLDSDKIYNQIAEQSAKLLGCQIACVLLWDKKRQKVEVVSSYGTNESEGKTLQTQLGASGLLPDLVADHQSVAIGDAQTDPRVPPAWRERFHVRALLCLPIWGTEEPLGFLFLIDQRASRRWRPEELKLIESFVNRAAVALVNANLHKQLEWAAALEERQRIAANMHDGLAQTLGLLGLRVDQATELIATGRGQKAAKELRRIREAVEQASGQVRRSIASLQEPPRPRRSLQDLLSDLLNQFSTSDGLPVDLAIRVQEPLFLPPEHRAQVLPVVQEALLNARRHAQAQRIAVVLERRGDQVRITVEDDGPGFDLNASREDNEGHFGLSIMRARAARIGGRLQIDSAPGQGTRVSLTWVPNVDRNQAQYDSIQQVSTPQTMLSWGAER